MIIRRGESWPIPPLLKLRITCRENINMFIFNVTLFSLKFSSCKSNENFNKKKEIIYIYAKCIYFILNSYIHPMSKQNARHGKVINSYYKKKYLLRIDLVSTNIPSTRTAIKSPESVSNRRNNIEFINYNALDASR
jgi:hypothetical protein